MRKLNSSINVDNSDLTNYPDGRIKNNIGTGNGTPVNEFIYGDIVQAKEKLARLYGIVANGLPDNETNGFQLIDALRALASKNDFILPLTLDTGVLSVPIKLGFMLENEQVVCKADFNMASQTQIKGSDNTTFKVSVIGGFKTNEYVRLIKNASGVTIIRLADDLSLNDMVNQLNYLKAASGAEVIAGTIDNKAVTPESFLEAFAEYVLGAESDNFLADATRNGLYPKEHFDIVNNLGSVKNIGWFSGLNVSAAPSPTSLPVSGDIASAVIITSGETGTSYVLITVNNAMSNSNYKVRTEIESQGVNMYDDLDVYSCAFKVNSTTQFVLGFSKNGNETTNIKVHIEVVQL